MKHPERVEDYLEHIAEAIERATSYLQHLKGVEEFLENQQVQDAVVRNIEVIGEAANKIQKMPLPYGITMTGACQNAALWPAGSSTVTSQSYSPGLSVASGKLSVKGNMWDFGFKPAVTSTGGVSITLVAP
jgi:hypothetical protein